MNSEEIRDEISDLFDVGIRNVEVKTSIVNSGYNDTEQIVEIKVWRGVPSEKRGWELKTNG